MASRPSPEQTSAAALPRGVRAATRLGITLGILAMLLGVLDTEAIADTLTGVDLPPILAALALVQAQIVLSAWRWRMVAERLGLRLSLGTATAEYYVASFLNLVLPGGMPGDAVRALRLRFRQDGEAPGWRLVVRSIILERVAGQIALGLVTVAGFAAWPLIRQEALPAEATWATVGALAVVCVALLILMLVARVGPATFRSALAGFGHDAWHVLAADGAWLKQGLVNLAVVASYVFSFAFAAVALGHPLPPAGLLTVVPVVLFSMVLPVTIGGWGVREAVAAGMWPLLGLDATTGFATSVLYGLIALAGSSPALILFLFKHPHGGGSAT